MIKGLAQDAIENRTWKEEVVSKRVIVPSTERRIQEPHWRQLATGFLRVLEQKDAYTRGHSQRVHDYANMLAVALGWGAYLRGWTSVAALLHDIGKVVVERSTINNPFTTLTPQQRGELIDHPYTGAQIVAGLFDEEVTLGILGHHERIDGNVESTTFPAYPFGIKGDKISPIARVIAVVDTFDAMTTRRAYSVPMSKVDALRRLKEGAGTRHDAQFVAAFIKEVAPGIEVTERMRFTMPS